MIGSTHDSTKRAILYAFLANFGIAITKTWAAIVTGSGSMRALKIKLDPDLTINEAIDHINRLKRELKERIPKLKWCFVEPDVTD